MELGLAEHKVANSENTGKVFTPLGASNHSKGARAEIDFYATDPVAIKKLMDEGGVTFHKKVWECACGQGHLAKVLVERGYDVKASDAIDRGYGETGIDFLHCYDTWDGDIITNPPYSNACDFAEHALDIMEEGCSVYLFLKLQFLEGKRRRILFDRKELKTLYVFTERVLCAKNGDFADTKGSAVAYGWFQFEKGYKGDPVIKWL